ncbi:MAG: hypothetical protein U5J62_11195 [Desulfurivibrio sp.]|nr:hypothetical protein [Desulfurivibrio sp.]
MRPKNASKQLKKDDESTKSSAKSDPPSLIASQPFEYLTQQPQAQKALFYSMTTGLVQQTDQVAASRDLSLLVSRLLAIKLVKSNDRHSESLATSSQLSVNTVGAFSGFLP